MTAMPLNTPTSIPPRPRPPRTRSAPFGFADESAAARVPLVVLLVEVVLGRVDVEVMVVVLVVEWNDAELGVAMGDVVVMLSVSARPRRTLQV